MLTPHKAGFALGTEDPAAPPRRRFVALQCCRNLLIETLPYELPHVRASFEQLAALRAAATGLIAQVSALSGRTAAFEGERSVQLEAVHSMTGNTQRFQIGATEIRVDDEWRRHLPRRTRRG